MEKVYIIVAALFGAIGVMIGAFGAHAFKDMLVESGHLDTFNTAIEYHFYHTLAALIAPILLNNSTHSGKAKTASFLFLLGIVLFSGSLYLISFTEITYVGFLTPIGGVSFILGWIILSYAAYRSEFKDLRKKEDE
jgi:uncharacterized membrane protein YgdD (TMEM256/DUF423 family)